MSVLDRNSILEAMTLKTERVPLGDGEVIVSEIGGSDYIALWSDPNNQKVNETLMDKDGKPVTEVDMTKFTPALIVKCVVDEAGNRIFADSDVDLIAKGARGPFMAIAESARKLNGMSGEAEKNSDDNQPSLPSIDSP